MGDRMPTWTLRELLDRANKGGDVGAHQHLASNVRSLAAEVLELRARVAELEARVVEYESCDEFKSGDEEAKRRAAIRAMREANQIPVPKVE